MGEQRDVVVVGAGPAGATAAVLMAREGFSVALLDRQRFPRPKACAEYMSPGVREVLSRLGLQPALDGARGVKGMEIVAPSGRRLRVAYSNGGVATSASALPRVEFDHALVRLARGAGASVHEGIVVRQPIVEGDRVLGVRGTCCGEEVEMRARLTIIADGARSVLAGALGLTGRVRWPVRMGLVAHMDGLSFEGDFGQMYVSRGGYCGVAPLPGGRANVAMVLPPGTVRASGVSASLYFQRWIASHAVLSAALEGATAVSGVRGVSPIGARVRRSWAPGALLVGDAAGFYDPFTGEGIYRALRSAELAAEVGARALTTGDVDGGLAPYEYLRGEAFRRKSAITALVQLFVRYPSLLEYAIPRLGARERPLGTLGNVLGDVADAATFLRPGMLWEALRP
jgi:menaquinone-9 beta-reductase